MTEKFGVDPDEVPQLESNAERKEKEAIFADMWWWMERYINRVMTLKGWTKVERRDGELFALIHSEISEAVEAARTGNQKSKVVPEITEVEEELADAIIRIMDMAYAKKYNLPMALILKMKYNETRPYRHGGKLF